MDKLIKTLGVGALALILNGCDKAQFLEGKVTKEGGTVVNLVQSSGALFGNESVKLGEPNYVLTVETTNGKYVMEVIEHTKPLRALAEMIEVGDRVKFQVFYGSGVSESFSKDKVGRVYSFNIEVLGKTDVKARVN